MVVKSTAETWEATNKEITEEEIKASEISNFKAGEELRVYGRIISPEHFMNRQAYEDYQKRMDLKEENEIRALEGKPPLTEMFDHSKSDHKGRNSKRNKIFRVSRNEVH